jgi:hypothetical protein
VFDELLQVAREEEQFLTHAEPVRNVSFQK